MVPQLSRLRRLIENLPLRPTIAAALLLGLALPVMLAIWRDVSERRTTLIQTLYSDHQRLSDVLAIAMSTPIWEVRPETARPIVDVLMRDPRVVEIDVKAPLIPHFLNEAVDERRHGGLLSREGAVMRGGQQIGVVHVTMTTAPLEAEVLRQGQQALLTGLAQFLFGLLLLLPLLRLKVLSPVRRLVAQSRELASGNFAAEESWFRRDELGVLGRAFEETRRSLLSLVAELKQANAHLRAREADLLEQAQRLRAILDNMTDGISLVDRELRLQAWNDRFIDILDVAAAPVRDGMPISELHAYGIARNTSSEETAQRLRDGFVPGQPWQTQIETARGTVVSLRRQPLADGGFVTTYTDVTEQVRAQRTADEARQLLEAVMDAVPAVLHVKDGDLRYRLVNRYFLDLWRFRREEVIGRTISDVFPPGWLAEFTDHSPDVLSSGRRLPFYETRIGLPGGDHIDLLGTKVPLCAEDGTVTHVVTVEIDITQRKRAEQALRESEELYRLLVDLSPFGIMLHDKVRIRFLNAAGCRVLGVPDADRLLGMHLIDFVDASGQTIAAERLRRILELGEPLRQSERRLQSVDGAAIDAQLAAVPVRLGGEVLALIVFQDISERKRAERERRRWLQLFQDAIAAIPNGFAVFDSSRALVICNAAFAHLYGSTPAAMVGRPARVLLGEFATLVAAVDGRPAKELAADLDALLERLWPGTPGPQQVELKDGRWLLIDNQHTAEGGMVVVRTDITELKRAEEEIARQHSALHQAEKMSALGALLAGVAHELNNPLSIVVGRSIMLEDAPLEPAVAASISKIRTAAERCARIVRTFLAMARQQAPVRVPVCIDDIIAAALDLMGYGLANVGVEIIQDIEADLPQTLADPDQLTQVFNNLIVNAKQAMAETPPPRTLRISARAAWADDTGAVMLRVTFADSGPGIDAAIQARVFDPFFTTKPAGVGTGIGLAVCRGIIEAHGGSIALEPANGTGAGAGAAFTITLPAIAGESECAALDPFPRSGRGTLRILIVAGGEVAAQLRDILTRDGHDVEIAADGHTALDRVAVGRADIVLCDLVTPGLDAIGLYRAIRARYPRLTAHTAFITTRTGLDAKLRRFLLRTRRPTITTPFTPEQLRRLVQSLATSRWREHRRTRAGQRPAGRVRRRKS